MYFQLALFSNCLSAQLFHCGSQLFHCGSQKQWWAEAAYQDQYSKDTPAMGNFWHSSNVGKSHFYFNLSVQFQKLKRVRAEGAVSMISAFILEDHSETTHKYGTMYCLYSSCNHWQYRFFCIHSTKRLEKVDCERLRAALKVTVLQRHMDIKMATVTHRQCLRRPSQR